MTDEAAPLLLDRPRHSRRRWFLAPGEPRDRKTFESLINLALRDVADCLHSDVKSATFLAAIGKHGREGHIRGLERRIADMIAGTLTNQTTRQPVKRATVSFHCVPVPSESRVCGVVIVHGWRHTFRSTFDTEILK